MASRLMKLIMVLLLILSNTAFAKDDLLVQEKNYLAENIAYLREKANFSTGQVDGRLFFSSELIDRILALADGVEEKTKEGIVLRIKKIRTAFMPGFPRLKISAIIGSLGEPIPLNISAVLVPNMDNNNEQLVLKPLLDEVKLKSTAEGEKGIFSQLLLLGKQKMVEEILQFLVVKSSIKLPLRHHIPMMRAAEQKPQSIKLGNGNVQGQLNLPALHSDLAMVVNAVIFHDRGIDTFVSFNPSQPKQWSQLSAVTEKNASLQILQQKLQDMLASSAEKPDVQIDLATAGLKKLLIDPLANKSVDFVGMTVDGKIEDKKSGGPFGCGYDLQLSPPNNFRIVWTLDQLSQMELRPGENSVHLFWPMSFAMSGDLNSYINPPVIGNCNSVLKLGGGVRVLFSPSAKINVNAHFQLHFSQSAQPVVEARLIEPPKVDAQIKIPTDFGDILTSLPVNLPIGKIGKQQLPALLDSTIDIVNHKHKLKIEPPTIQVRQEWISLGMKVIIEPNLPSL